MNPINTATAVLKGLGVGLGAASILAGCSGPVRLSSEWQPKADRNQAFERVLVVGLSPNAGVRCDFESFMMNQLRATIEAKSSCLLMKTTEPLTRESIERVIAEYQPDAVLTTSLVHSADGAEEGGSRDTRGAAYYKATDTGYADPFYGPYGRYGYGGGYGAWGVPVVYVEFETAPVVTSVEGEVTILSMLYATRDASLVYEVTTTAKDLHSRDDALAKVTGPIADRLRRDGVVKE